jgi:hypothetical protein
MAQITTASNVACVKGFTLCISALAFHVASLAACRCISVLFGCTSHIALLRCSSTPLHRSARWSQGAAIALLLSHGADESIKDGSGHAFRCQPMHRRGCRYPRVRLREWADRTQNVP